MMPIRANVSIIATVLLLAASFPAYAENQKVRLRTVVLDAGHGGHDPGAVSRNSKLTEKAMNLDIVLRLGKLIEEEYPDVDVIYTRKTDVFKELAERSNIANRNKADLFISVHVNSSKNTSASGTESFVMGTDKSEKNMQVCRTENSVIMLEDDYTTTYQGFDPDNAESYIFFNLMQNAYMEQSIALASMVQQQFKSGPITRNRGVKQAPLMVLWRTTMPSVLIEVGFISNPSDCKLLNSASNRQKIAGGIFKAFSAFKKQYDDAVAFEYDESVMSGDDEDLSDGGEKTTVSASTEPYYAIQILAVKTKLKPGSPDLKRITDYEYRFINGLYKYYVGNFPSKEEAKSKLSEIRRTFPGAFIVTLEPED